MDNAHNNIPHVGAITALSKDSIVMCAIPHFGAPNTYKPPENCGGDFRQLAEEHKTLFGIVPGKATLDCHYISTNSLPIRVSLNTFQGIIVRKLSNRLS